jgi:hypothetical protein
MKPFDIPRHPTTDQLRTLVSMHGVKFVNKSDSRLMRLLARVLPAGFMTIFWTTIGRTVYTPAYVGDPYIYPTILSHELVHVRQHIKWQVWYELSYLLLPLPVLFAYGRWCWEREAYMQNLSDRPTAANVEYIVNSLWKKYAWTWPRFLMRRWFNKQLRGI